MVGFNVTIRVLSVTKRHNKANSIKLINKLPI